MTLSQMANDWPVVSMQGTLTYSSLHLVSSRVSTVLPASGPKMLPESSRTFSARPSCPAARKSIFLNTAPRPVALAAEAAAVAEEDTAEAAETATEPTFWIRV